MKLYRITIIPISSFCSPLQSDTFFGAFCWSYLYRYGEQSLLGLISDHKANKPDIIFSNAFPHGMLPIPAGINEGRGVRQKTSSKQERYKKYIETKKSKQSSTIPLDAFNKVINGCIPDTTVNIGPDERSNIIWRNMVNRKTDTVDNTEGESNLFETEQYFSSKGFDVYIYTTLPEKILNPVLTDMFRAGIGAQRSIGKGAFEITESLTEFNGFKFPSTPNAFLSLSNFIPKKEDPVNGHYRTFVKYPKVSHISSDKDSPFKKPLIFLNAGSIFFDDPVKSFYGSCIEKIALKDDRVSDDIIISAYTIAIPCCIDHSPHLQD